MNFAALGLLGEEAADRLRTEIVVLIVVIMSGVEEEGSRRGMMFLYLYLTRQKTRKCETERVHFDCFAVSRRYNTRQRLIFRPGFLLRSNREPLAKFRETQGIGRTSPQRSWKSPC